MGPMELGFGGWRLGWFARFPIVVLNCYYWVLSSTRKPNLSQPIVTLLQLQEDPQLAHVPSGSRLFLAIAARFDLRQ